MISSLPVIKLRLLSVCFTHWGVHGATQKRNDGWVGWSPPPNLLQATELDPEERSERSLRALLLRTDAMTKAMLTKDTVSLELAYRS